MTARGTITRDTRHTRRTRPAAAALAALALTVPVLAGCSTTEAGPASGGSPAASSTPSAPVVSVAGGSTVGFDEPVRLTVRGGTLSTVDVTSGGASLAGSVAGGGASWVSTAAPRPATTYTVAATVKDPAGQDRKVTTTFAVRAVPASQRLAYTVTPDDGKTVGIAQPVVVRFTTPVTERADVEKAMTVEATTKDGATVDGSWHWVNGQQIDWRPKSFWDPGTKVRVDMRLAGVKASAKRYGRKDYSETFTIGGSRVLKVDLVTHRAKLYHDGKLLHTWPTGGGMKGLETYSGTYVVLGKAPVVQMDSCSAGITCDKKNPEYYDEKEYWATRLTRSGTFVHAASWDGRLGQANVSHGCIHLADQDAKTFYDQARPGDVVIVSRSGRGPQERIASQDPGLYDWNLSWAKWTAGSALH